MPEGIQGRSQVEVRAGKKTDREVSLPGEQKKRNNIYEKVLLLIIQYSKQLANISVKKFIELFLNCLIFQERAKSYKTGKACSCPPPWLRPLMDMLVIGNVSIGKRDLNHKHNKNRQIDIIDNYNPCPKCHLYSFLTFTWNLLICYPL